MRDIIPKNYCNGGVATVKEGWRSIAIEKII